MTTPGDSELPRLAAEIAELYEAKAIAELKAADALAPGSDVVASRGFLLPDVALVKGLPGPAESSGGAAMLGADGEALGKALAALGFDPEHLFFTLSRPEPGLDGAARVARLKAIVEAVDAELVIALDTEATEDLAAGFGVKRLTPGKIQRKAGRRLLAVDGFEASLLDAGRKRRAWGQLKAAVPRAAVY